MLKRFFAFLVSVALIASPLAAEGLNSSDLNFAFGKSDAQAPQLSSDLSIMTDQQMSETEGELIHVVIIHAGRAIATRHVSKKVATSIVKKGGNVIVKNRSEAKQIAKAASKGKPNKVIREKHTNRGTGHSHYHTNPRGAGGHVLYGKAGR